jgi:hypothetical protein
MHSMLYEFMKNQQAINLYSNKHELHEITANHCLFTGYYNQSL